MASKISKSEWLILKIIVAIIDIIQLVFSFLGYLFSETVVALILIVINDYADPFIGVGLLAYFQFRGVNMLRNWQRSLSLVCVGGMDELTGGVASFWILDVMYIHSTVKKEQAEIDTQKQQMMMQNMVRQPLYQNGMRRPETQTASSYDENDSDTGSNEPNTYVANYNNRPLNQNGVRVSVNTNNKTSTITSNSTKPIKQSVSKIKV